MKFFRTTLEGVYIIEVEPFIDERGLFARTFCQNEFATIGFNEHIVQINQSITKKKGTIRGMHFQFPPACETKIVRCISGSIFDAVVDLRAGSPTFLKWYATELSTENMRMVYIPEGFAHGFQTLTDNTELIYLHSEFYSPDHEGGLRYDDPEIAIEWPLPVYAVSPRDRSYELVGESFKGIES